MTFKLFTSILIANKVKTAAMVALTPVIALNALLTLATLTLGWVDISIIFLVLTGIVTGAFALLYRATVRWYRAISAQSPAWRINGNRAFV